MPDRVCVLHVGTHKTGTTSLQYFLQSNAEALERAGIAFSKTGWYGVVPGNHNVAWDLLAGHFDNYVRQLKHELQELSAQSIVLSAEDLSLLHQRPLELARFIEMIRGAGFNPKILVYLRDQAGFAESMYAERIKHGSVEQFEEYVERVIDSGTHEAGGSTIDFRYDRMLDSFAEAVGRENVLARPYSRSGDDLAIFHDFLGAFEQLVPGFRAGGLSLELHHPRVNESLTFGALLGNVFVRLRPNDPVPNDGKAFFDRWVPHVPAAILDSRFFLLSPSDVVRFASAFAGSNERLRERFGVTMQFRRLSAHENVTGVQREVLAACINQWRNNESGFAANVHPPHRHA